MSTPESTLNRKPTVTELDELTLDALRSIGETTAAEVHRTIQYGWITSRHEYGDVTLSRVRSSLDRHWRAERVYRVLVPLNAPVFGKRESNFYGIAS